MTDNRPKPGDIVVREDGEAYEIIEVIDEPNAEALQRALERERDFAMKREDVERYLAYANENIQHFGPREGSAVPAASLAALCERWLAVEDAPVVPITEQTTFPARPPVDWSEPCFTTTHAKILRCDPDGRIVPEGGGDGR